MKKSMMTSMLMLAMTAAMAQSNKPAKMDAATLTEFLVKQLGLNSTQKTKVSALNKKYESVLGGPGMGGPGMGGPRPERGNREGNNEQRGQRPELTDSQKAEMQQRQTQRQAYEKELKGILTDDQYKSYQNMGRPQGNGEERNHESR